ncbi:radical SAM superfamily protein [Ruminiclostridium hungatei]|uniref:Radical SAM superfamily protein n=1 Tax=Ruminiclostridium hungatei TaxID=48256 RepID=A0A1V4SQA2_RUMHU|nr:radical SAM protein [Ruminiclostridium hungatei]OPX45646.1 radical SAM superfamily protein [Ruminiclostridium hungatei]
MTDLCNSCPRNCNKNRKVETGYCGVTEQPKVARAFLHMWEEPCISGTRGSGTIFFSGCNLKCVYCQNFSISQKNFGREITEGRLEEIVEELVHKGAHNINLVNPSHYVHAIARVLRALKAEGKLTVPVVYNSNGYESIEALKAIEGLIDIYLPDMKYSTCETSLKYSKAKDYPHVSQKAVLEMYRQVGSPVLDDSGIIHKGLVIRHLILPGHTKESISVLNWISESLPKSVYVSLMSQYTPFYDAEKYPEINRPITRKEYQRVVEQLYKLGLEEGYVQERQSADTQYIPDFNLEGV